jgi:uncharacterized protein (DUF488 family)
MGTIVYTIGHSTRTFEQFLGILRGFGIETIVDIRTIPRSRHNPQFNGDVLKVALEANDLVYVHLKGLGGLRHPTGDKTNAGWRNASFRGFADYIQTAEFGEALKELIEIARKRSTVIMCAEAVPWRCHRSLIGDALLVSGLEVVDILDADKSKVHRMTPWAKVVEGRITYPAAESLDTFAQDPR